MNTTCKCGTKMRRTDIALDVAATRKYGREMYRDTDPLVANWRCPNCGAVRTQRKRQPKTK